MIILRYLIRELLISSLAVTSILIVVIMSSDFIRYLAEAVAGKVDAGVLFTLMFYRLPNFLELILPIGFFISILMVYGRLYAEHEMTVLFACGMSRKQLIAKTYVAALLVAVCAGITSLWLTPLGLQASELIKAQQKNRSDLETLQAGRFQAIQNNQMVSYAESVGDKQLSSVFLANVGVAADKDLFTIRADAAETYEHPDYKQRYLTLQDGIRYQGRPGELAYRVTHFEHYAQRVDVPVILELSAQKVDLRSTASLLGSTDNKERATLQWRIASPVLVLVVALLGVALSHTTPRRGRYVMLFPSILLYMVYVVMLNAARGAVEEGSLPAIPGLWLVHALFFFIALALFVSRDKRFGQWFTGRKRQQAVS